MTARRPLRRLLAPGVLALVVGTALPAYAAPVAPYEMPFPCGQTWVASSRSYHSPSPNAVDWNRDDDFGMPVVAAAGGKIEVADTVDNSGYGKWVQVDHDNGETTIYAHMDKVTVKEGQVVDQGEQLGNLGTTGNSTGPHLHFEERDGSSVIHPWFHGKKLEWGSNTSQNCVTVPMAANFRADAKAEFVIYRRGDHPTFEIMHPTKPRVITFGTTADDPLVGDWDGNGYANVGVRTPATKTFYLKLGDEVTEVRFGGKKDQPVAGDWDGDGVDEIGVWRPATAAFRLRRDDGSVKRVGLGTTGSLPVTGDWNGDGITDVGVYDRTTSTFTLRLSDADGLTWLASVKFGKAYSLPVTGDWDGNGRTDVGVWVPATATFALRKAPSPMARQVALQRVVYGDPR